LTDAEGHRRKGYHTQGGSGKVKKFAMGARVSCEWGEADDARGEG